MLPIFYLKSITFQLDTVLLMSHNKTLHCFAVPYDTLGNASMHFNTGSKLHYPKAAKQSRMHLALCMCLILRNFSEI